jgi:hypothetical protein
MPRTSDKDRVRTWQKRVISANKVYDEWSEKYKCDTLEQYYEGHQWGKESEDEDHYTINLVFPSIEIKIPSLLFYRPQVRIRPRPTRSDDKQTMAEERAKLQQDVVNTFLSDKRIAFKEETTLALRESFFRFGVVEVGYSGDFVDNPLLAKPELTDEESELAKSPKIPNPNNAQPETLYIKHIPAKQFRVGVSSKNLLQRCDWVGYYEEMYASDIKANPRYKNTSNLKASGKIQKKYMTDLEAESEPDEDGHVPNKDTIRIWKIWDLRTKKRVVFADSGEKFLLEESFSYLPFAVYKQYERLNDFYPLPPVFNWLDPQNELNETREMQKVHRKRFYRRYTYRDGAIDEPELRKLEDGGDGVYAKCNQPDPIQPVPDAPLDPAIARNLPTSKADFLEISGVSDEQRGQSDPDTTATQANIVDTRSRIRESYQRNNVSEWLSEICWLMLKTIKDNMALPIWVMINCDPEGPNFPEEAMKTGVLWQQITAQDLGDIEYDISVDVNSMTPVSEESERQQWMQVLALISNPQLMSMLLGSDTLLRKTLGYFNVKSEREINEIRQSGMKIMMMMAAAAAQKQGVGGPQGPPQPGGTPGNAEIQGQLQQQL